MIRPRPRSTPFPYTTLFRSSLCNLLGSNDVNGCRIFERDLSLCPSLTGLPAGRGMSEQEAMTPAKIIHFMVFWLPNHSASLRSEEHTSELQSRLHLVCRLLL